MPTFRETGKVILIKEFVESHGTVSAVSLVEHFHKEINKVTVYRILARLEENGDIHSFLDAKGLTWYGRSKKPTPENHCDNHSHFQCLHCGRIECIEIEVYIKPLPNRRIDNQIILFQGSCENCLTKHPEKSQEKQTT